MRRAKISIIGAGNVGATCAHWAAAKELGDIVLLDIPDKGGRRGAKTLDLACSFADGAARCKRHRHLGLRRHRRQRCGDRDRRLPQAGHEPRRPDRDEREDREERFGEHQSSAPDSVVILVSNPLDAMVYTAWKATGFPTNRIVGQAGCLDVAVSAGSSRERSAVQWRNISALLLGGHGDDMVPLPGSSVHGVPVSIALEAEITECVERAKVGGGEIVAHGHQRVLRPGLRLGQMAEAIIRTSGSCPAPRTANEYGIGGYFVGVPCILGSNGVEGVIDLKKATRRRWTSRSAT